jgi:hypothetical protein
VNRARLNVVAIAQQHANALEDSLHLRRSGPVSKTQDPMEPEPIACTDIFQTHGSDPPIGYADHGSIHVNDRARSVVTGASHANGLFEGERDPPMTFPASFALRERRRCRRRRAQPAQQMGLHRSSTSKPAKLRITSQTQPAMARMLAVPDQNCRDKSDKPTLVSIENDKGLKQETYRHGQGFRIGEIGLSVKAPTQPPTSELRIRFTSAAKAQNRGMPTRRPAIQTKQYRRIGIHQEFGENVVRRYDIGFFIKIRNGVESLAGSVPFRSILVPLTPT